jgi:hypothetical protein
MKKLTFITGVVSVFLILIGVIFRIEHWTGGGVILTIGGALFTLVYSVLLLIDKNKIAKDSFQKFVNLMTMLTMLVIPAAALFKIQHWPGAGYGIYAAHLLLLIMIPVLFMHASKETDPVKKLNLNIIAIILVLLTAVSFYIWLYHPIIPAQ